MCVFILSSALTNVCNVDKACVALRIQWSRIVRAGKLKLGSLTLLKRLCCSLIPSGKFPPVMTGQGNRIIRLLTVVKTYMLYRRIDMQNKPHDVPL